MKAPARKRRRPREIGKPVGVDLNAVAKRAKYVGSPEHKDTPSFAGPPKPRRPRGDATICDRRFATMQDELTKWLRDAIRKGAVSPVVEGSFPRYAWCMKEGLVYEARLSNRESGTYKGYELGEHEWPKGIQEIYDA